MAAEKSKTRLFVAGTPSPRLYLDTSTVKKSVQAAAVRNGDAPAGARLYLDVRKS